MELSSAPQRGEDHAEADAALAVRLQLEEVSASGSASSSYNVEERVRRQQQHQERSDLALALVAHEAEQRRIAEEREIGAMFGAAEQRAAAIVGTPVPRPVLLPHPAPGPQRRQVWGAAGTLLGGDNSRRKAPPAHAPPIPAPRQASHLCGELRWHCTVDALVCLVMIAPLGPAALATLLSPAAGHVSAAKRDWRLAAVHTGLALVNVILRCIAPLLTPNFVHATIAVACALAGLHALWLASRWLVLIWRHGAVLQPVLEHDQPSPRLLDPQGSGSNRGGALSSTRASPSRGEARAHSHDDRLTDVVAESRVSSTARTPADDHPPASERVVVASFDSSALERFRQACPEVATAHGLTEVVQLFLASLFGAQAVVSPPGANLAVPHYFSLGGMRIEVPTSGFVGAARTRGLDVQTYDVEDPVTMVDLYARGVQAMLTDRVDLALAVRLTEWPRTCGLDPPVPVPRAVPAYRACASLGRCSAGSRARPPTSA